MGPYDFSTVTDRTDTLSVKWNKQAIESVCSNPDARPFWVADMDFPAPPAVLEALRGHVDHGILGYPAFTALPETFTEWAAKRHRWTIDPAMVTTTPGMLASIALLVELLSGPKDSVILPMPAYQPFVHIIRGLGRTIVPWPMRYHAVDHTFDLDIPMLEELSAAENTPLLLFCSPHNPTGRVFTTKELETVADIAAKNDLAVISDEIHADLTLVGHTHTPFDVVARTYGVPCVTCMAPSKTFNIAGEHFSVVVCSDRKLQARLTRRLRALHLAPDLLATVTAVAAYKGGYDWLEALRRHLTSQVISITTALEKRGNGLRFVVPQASFIGFIDCQSMFPAIQAEVEANPQVYHPERSPNGGVASRFFGQRANVAMNDGTWFGSDYANFVRFNYGTTTEAVSEAIEAIAASVETLA